ncbi:maleylpyruvate isomerase N-terminal domain-containing protein [Streptomyces virginiae]|uniref:maleylpyruvate isomerase N-terminal domain-containing protein n=1 Tax=Streptomyces virginiae TaxID=1961 RepID=UPI0030E00123
MDHVERLVVLRTETAAFEKAVRRAFDLGEPVPAVPSCPGWSVTDLVRHLGGVHRYLAHVLRERLTVPPDPAGLTPPSPRAARTR